MGKWEIGENGKNKIGKKDVNVINLWPIHLLN
jgi:hypothetical protein